MKKYDFDEIIERRGTDCEKWDGLEDTFGSRDLTPLWVADMDFKAPPEIVDALRDRVEHGIFGYTRYPDSWYDAFRDWVGKRHDWKIEKDWITHSPGIVTAMGLSLMAFTEPGDKVVIQPPVYHHFEEEIRLNARTPLTSPLKYENGRFTMDLEDLEKKLDGARMMILCNPHNPAGRVWTEEELRAVADLCVEHDVVLVSDEIHCDVIYKGHVHRPIATVSPEIKEKCAVFMAPSKTFNIAGFKASAVVIPNEKLREKFNSVLDSVHVGGGSCMSIPAFEAAYRHGGPWLDELLDYLEGSLDMIEEFLTREIPSVKLVRPEGTYVPLVDLRALSMSPEELHEFLINAGVAMNSGAMFGKGGEGFARLNIATPRSILQEGLKKIASAVRSLG
ncbi:MAG: MalY/PatB family protein [Synergistota bacterium]|nr:MalY/PatB family protein [Synergistota bacterium]